MGPSIYDIYKILAILGQPHPFVYKQGPLAVMDSALIDYSFTGWPPVVKEIDVAKIIDRIQSSCYHWFGILNGILFGHSPYSILSVYLIY